jgi:hypothetical protein
LLASVVGRPGDQRARERLVAASRPSPDLDDAVAVVDALDVHPLLSGRVDVLARADLVVLGREAQRVDERLRRLRQWPRVDVAVHFEAADRLAVALDERLLVGVESLEVGPPLGLCLAAVVVEELGEQPAGLVLVVAGLAILGHSLGERRLQLVDLGPRLGVWLSGLRRLPPRDLAAEPLDRLGATLEQPAVQQPGRAAVVVVVALDRLEQPGVAGVEELLEGEDRVSALGHGLALVHVEGLDLLDRVVRLGDA